MATPQFSPGYTPPIGGFWGNLPILSSINEISDLTSNPDANIAHDVTGLLGTAIPGPAGLPLSLLSSALPGGWLDSVLGLGSFSDSVTLPGATGTGALSGVTVPDITATQPGTGFWGDVQNLFSGIGDRLSGSTSGLSGIFDALGGGVGTIAETLGSGFGDSFGGTDTGTNRSIGGKFGG